LFSPQKHPHREVRRVVVIGPESTGKSTLAAALAAALDTAWVPEQARSVLESLGWPYCEEDLAQIAEAQMAAEDAQLRSAKAWLVCDTDASVVRVWSEERYGRCAWPILHCIAARRPHAYLLTYPDLPWEADPLREHPALADRLRFWHQYHTIAQEDGVPFADLRGDAETRLQSALQFLATL